MVGQREPVSVMRAVAANPDTAPRCYIFQGQRGLGKTSLCRVFARALACKSPIDSDACLACEACIGFADFTPAYQEYDSTQVGNVAFMRTLKEHLYYTKAETGMRVIVFDETHAASQQAQSALLKLLEEGPKDTFFIMATTDVDKVLPTIRSRSVELSFSPVSDAELKSLIERIIAAEKLAVPVQVVEAIVAYSFGFMRDAVMRLDLYAQIKNPDEFMGVVRVPEKDVLDLFIAIKEQNKEEFVKALASLTTFPLVYLRKSFEMFVLNSLKHFSGVEVVTFPERYAKVVTLYDSQLFTLLGVMSKDWVINCFKSDLAFQSLAWYFYNLLSKNIAGKSEVSGDRFNK